MPIDFSLAMGTQHNSPTLPEFCQRFLYGTVSGILQIPCKHPMRLTLRRSCDGCAKAKSRCDLQTPTCSRCMKRNVNCIFQNEPLTSTVSVPKNTNSLTKASPPVTTQSLLLESRVENRITVGVSPFPIPVGAGFPDPFDSYPQTSLPRIRVQGLIHHCGIPSCL